jgi:putative spermidine/putrescine transport system ATP-binding protein
MGFRNFFPVRIGATIAGMVDGAAAGLRLRGRADHGLGEGSEAIMAIRPDDIRLARSSDGNAIRGRVEIVEYLGREREALIRLDERTSLWLRTPEAIAPGDTVDLELPPDKVVVLRPE